MAKPKAKKPVKKAHKERIKAGQGREEVLRRYREFAIAFLAMNCNATQAAIAAGYSEATAYAKGHSLLKLVEVKELIAEMRAAARTIDDLSPERTRREIARIAYGNSKQMYRPDGTFIPVHELDDQAAAMIAGEEVDVLSTGVSAPSGDDDEDAEDFEHDQQRTVLRNHKRKYHSKIQALNMAAKIDGLYEKDNRQQRERVKIEVEFV